MSQSLPAPSHCTRPVAPAARLLGCASIIHPSGAGGQEATRRALPPHSELTIQSTPPPESTGSSPPSSTVCGNSCPIGASLLYKPANLLPRGWDTSFNLTIGQAPWMNGYTRMSVQCNWAVVGLVTDSTDVENGWRRVLHKGKFWKWPEKNWFWIQFYNWIKKKPIENYVI